MLKVIMARKIKYKQNLDVRIKELIDKILKLKPKNRPDIHEILRNSLFKDIRNNSVDKKSKKTAL